MTQVWVALLYVYMDSPYLILFSPHEQQDGHSKAVLPLMLKA